MFFLLLAVATCLGINAQSLNVMSFNIRLNTANDGINAWPKRSDKVSSQILFHQTDFVGVQEALHDQMMDLQKDLPDYSYVGVGRDDGKTKGEYSAIFYKKSRLSVIESGTVWLSKTPTVPGSKGWDANIPRIVTWAKFKDLQTKKLFYVFNTHFDHIGVEARRESAKYILHLVDSVAGTMPSVITGDFNAAPKDEPIKIIVDQSNAKHLTDSKAVSETPHYGPVGTFNAWKVKEDSELPIDHIFIRNKVKVLQHATLSQTWGNQYSSDHFPVFARVIIL